MNTIEECIIIRDYVRNLVDINNDMLADNPESAKELKKIAKTSRDLFNVLYENISKNNDQFLLFQDDVISLDMNLLDFREKYFVIHARGRNIFKIKQFGDFLLISIEDAKNILKKIKLKSFKTGCRHQKNSGYIKAFCGSGKSKYQI